MHDGSPYAINIINRIKLVKGLAIGHGMPMRKYFVHLWMAYALTTAAYAAVITPQLKTHKTTGSMAAGSTTLAVTGAQPFQVGDQVIIEIGGEAGQGQRGTQGVGGVIPGDPADGRYYNSADAPVALVAKVVTVDGQRLTLDKPAVVATRDAVVHYDNLPAWHAATFLDETKPVTMQGDVLVTIPAGSFAVSGMMQFYWHKPGWIIAGQGDDRTELFSPKGTQSVALFVSESPATTIRDIRFRGNVADHGYGTTWYQAAVDLSISPDSHIFNVVTINGWRGLNVSYSHNTTANNFRAYLMEPLRHYISWQIAWANSNGGGCTDCAVYSKHVTAALESFQSAGQAYVRTKLYGGMFSSNSSERLTVDDLYIRLAAKSAHLRDMLYNPMVNVNLNVDNQQGGEAVRGAGGIYRNVRLVQDGFIGADPSWGQLYMASGISIDGKTSNMFVAGGSSYLPDQRTPNGLPGINNYGGNKNIVVDGFLSCGLADDPPMWQPTIRNTGHTVLNSRARLIDAAVQEGNSNDVSACAAPGPFPDITPPPMAYTVR